MTFPVPLALAVCLRRAECHADDGCVADLLRSHAGASLSRGMKAVLHSISRRLNALSVAEHGGKVSTRGGAYRELAGWLGRVFRDRYHAHVLRKPTEMAFAVRYVLDNAEKHTGLRRSVRIVRDAYSSIADNDNSESSTAAAKGTLLKRVLRQLGAFVT